MHSRVTPAGSPLHTRVLYLFAGKSRQADMGEAFRHLGVELQTSVTVHEIDILRGGDSHDLTAPSLQAEIMENVTNGASRLAPTRS